MSRPSVYLAGPIRDLAYGEATDWREYARNYLDSKGIDAFSPMRGKYYLKDAVQLSDAYHNHPLSTRSAILSRDRGDCRNRDLIIANFKGAKKISMGTVMEVAWGDAFNTPIIGVMEDDRSNVHEHGLLCEALDYRVSDLQMALDMAVAILLPVK